MSDCPHLVREGCQIAAEWAGLSHVPVTPEACRVCCGSDNAQSLNRVTVSLGISATRTQQPARVREALERGTPILMQNFSVTELVARFGDAAARWVAAGCPRRSDEEVARLYAICSACEPHFVDDTCRVCGCAASLKRSVMNKLSLATESCPIGKWSAAGQEPDHAGDSEQGGAAAPPRSG